MQVAYNYLLGYLISGPAEFNLIDPVRAIGRAYPETTTGELVEALAQLEEDGYIALDKAMGKLPAYLIVKRPDLA